MTLGIAARAIDTTWLLVQEMLDVADRPLVEAVIWKSPAPLHVTTPLLTERAGFDVAHSMDCAAAVWLDIPFDRLTASCIG